eukprot:2704976-Pleurochrysis_carterae.AAC.1
MVGCERVFLSQAVIVNRVIASADGSSHGQQSSLHCISVSLLIFSGLRHRCLEQLRGEQGAHE